MENDTTKIIQNCQYLHLTFNNSTFNFAIFVDSQSTITIQRLTIFCLFYIGARNFLELSAIIYFDKQL